MTLKQTGIKLLLADPSSPTGNDAAATYLYVAVSRVATGVTHLESHRSLAAVAVLNDVEDGTTSKPLVRKQPSTARPLHPLTGLTLGDLESPSALAVPEFSLRLKERLSKDAVLVGRGLASCLRSILTQGEDYDQIIDTDTYFGLTDAEFGSVATFDLRHLATVMGLNLPPALSAVEEAALVRELWHRYGGDANAASRLALLRAAATTDPAPVREEILGFVCDSVCLSAERCSCGEAAVGGGGGGAGAVARDGSGSHNTVLRSTPSAQQQSRSGAASSRTAGNAPSDRSGHASAAQSAGAGRVRRTTARPSARNRPPNGNGSRTVGGPLPGAPLFPTGLAPPYPGTSALWGHPQAGGPPLLPRSPPPYQLPFSPYAPPPPPPPQQPGFSSGLAMFPHLQSTPLQLQATPAVSTDGYRARTQPQEAGKSEHAATALDDDPEVVVREGEPFLRLGASDPGARRGSATGRAAAQAPYDEEA